MSKSANLLVDGLGAPARIGLLLPLHWQAVVLLLAGATTGAEVVLASDPAALVGCDAAFVLPEHAQAALDAGVGDVLALSCTPLGGPAGPLPALVEDYSRDVPSYDDHYGGPRPRATRVLVGTSPVEPLHGLTALDRVLTTLPPSDPTGAGVLLGALATGASLILLRDGDAEAIAQAERTTVTSGTDVAGLTRWPQSAEETGRFP